MMSKAFSKKSEADVIGAIDWLVDRVNLHRIRVIRDGQITACPCPVCIGKYKYLSSFVEYVAAARARAGSGANGRPSRARASDPEEISL